MDKTLLGNDSPKMQRLKGPFENSVCLIGTEENRVTDPHVCMAGLQGAPCTLW